MFASSSEVNKAKVATNLSRIYFRAPTTSTQHLEVLPIAWIPHLKLDRVIEDIYQSITTCLSALSKEHLLSALDCKAISHYAADAVTNLFASSSEVNKAINKIVGRRRLL